MFLLRGKRRGGKEEQQLKGKSFAQNHIDCKVLLLSKLVFYSLLIVMFKTAPEYLPPFFFLAFLGSAPWAAGGCGHSLGEDAKGAFGVFPTSRGLDQVSLTLPQVSGKGTQSRCAPRRGWKRGGRPRHREKCLARGSSCLCKERGVERGRVGCPTSG